MRKNFCPVYSFEEIENNQGTIFPQGKKLVFTNGVFDILHVGHIRTLSESSKLGDFLIVGLNSDSSVRRLKGTHRPINDQNSRAKLLSALSFVDAVVIFHQGTPLDIIQLISPSVLVKGGDYRIPEIVGSDFVLSNGGSVFTIPFLDQISTTQLIEKSKISS